MAVYRKWKFSLFGDTESRVHNEKKLLRPGEHTSVNTALCSDEKRTEDQNQDNETGRSSQSTNALQVFTYRELEAATKKFSRANFIGEGGFGSVYKGCILPKKVHGSDSKLEVAVKKLNQKSLQGDKEWLTEINFLGCVHHPNLVKLVGYCSEDNERGRHLLLVYELMPNRSLDEHLFGSLQPVLSWRSRVNIALGAAHGLAYLHEGMEFQVIFRDFKTSNILLDRNFNAKLSDFGFARQGPSIDNTHVTTAIVGTEGYAAPEYMETGHLTSKSDVWSFGVVLLELMTGRKAIDANRPKNEQRLLYWIKPFMLDGSQFPRMLDPRLEKNYSLKAAHRIAILSSKCLQPDPNLRPKMSGVVERLNQALELSELEYIHEKKKCSHNEMEATLTGKGKPWTFQRLAKKFHMKNGLLGCCKSNGSNG